MWNTLAEDTKQLRMPVNSVTTFWIPKKAGHILPYSGYQLVKKASAA
jgi:hypothetical protein